MSVFCIVPSAGRGVRMGRGIAKPYRKIGKIPLIIYTLRNLSQCRAIDQIILVVESSKVQQAKKLISTFSIKKIHDVVAGGDTRSESVNAGLGVLPSDCEIVLIHDGARPLVSKKLISKVAINTRKYGACIPGIKAHQTVKQVNKAGFVQQTLNREFVYDIQTPQGFRKDIITKAYARYKKTLNKKITDDSMLVERMGHKVKVINGEIQNIKVTTKEDLKGLLQ